MYTRITLSFELLDTSDQAFLDRFEPPCDDSFDHRLPADSGEWEPVEEDPECPFE